MSFLRSPVFKQWYAIEAVPIYFIIGGAVSGAGWYLTRLARGPDVVWTSKNKQPWNTVQPDQNTKFMAVNGRFAGGSWSRKILSLSIPTLMITTDSSAVNLDLPPLIAGGAVFSHLYNSNEHLSGPAPVDAVRLALRSGITAFDTSVYYGDSEIVLGNALATIKDEFPRDSYKILTKCGRLGRDHFEYSPLRIRQMVAQSLERFHTDYLDVVFLHDVEFVCSGPQPPPLPQSLADDLPTNSKMAGSVLGEGDQNILDAFAELQKMKEEGLIGRIGISGYPLPTLLRVALLILHNPPYEPIDILLSYSHLNLQNHSLLSYISAFRTEAKVAQLLSASPLSMGLLTDNCDRTPSWHPAPLELKDAIREWTSWHRKKSEEEKRPAYGLPHLALTYAISSCHQEGIPLVIGMSNEQEVEEAVGIWRKITVHGSGEERQQAIQDFQELLHRRSLLNWSWNSP